MGVIGGDEVEGWEREEAMAAGGAGKERILVSVRLRPLSEREISRNDPSDWECINDTTIIYRNSLAERSMSPTAYTFDRVFGCECTTKQVYEEGAKEVALSVVSGINSSIFAYGQTSSGKTYTMTGITENTVADIFDYIKRHEERAFVLKFSAMEIYNESVKDLLSTDSTLLRLLDDPERGTIVEKITEETLRDWSHLKQLISVCEAQRQIGETLLNEASSRSHQILKLTVESSAREFLGKDNSSTLIASVNFVDLAGSERASQALSAGARLKEGCHINRSLLTLGTVIRKLSKGRNGHIPYRDSKLTRILQPFLGGNARTAIICTMCPARSHIEQSRNTLLFASCAKEVVTNAQVNVVMSDKALVKHLQREVARLETELRYPQAVSTTSYSETLLREKDVRIRKLEVEIKELIQQRDLAQSRVEDLLHLSGGVQTTRPWDETSSLSKSHLCSRCEDVISLSEASTVAYQGVGSGSRRFSASYEAESCNEHHARFSSKPRKKDSSSPRHSVTSSSFTGLIPFQNGGKIAEEASDDIEDLCKEVRCIEMDETSTVRSEATNHRAEGSKSQLPSALDSPMLGDHESSHGDREMRPLGSDSPVITLEQQLLNVRKMIKNLVKPDLDESSSWSSVRAIASSRDLALTRSRSCRAALTSCSSPWFQEIRQDGCTPPSSFLKDYPGRSERFQRTQVTVNYGAQTEIPVAGSMETAHMDYQEQFTDSQVQVRNLNTNADINGGNTTKDIGVDPMLVSLESPSSWPLEFDKKLHEIVELWQACNVSLVHRTCFFLLFKGDPADSIYMEVELRRLSFLKSTSSMGHLDNSAALDGQNISMASSRKNLRRERIMLCRQMQKKLSAAERESLYAKWGIALDSKQRKLQMVRRLWNDTEDMENVRESASVVAKLIGLMESGNALKEMFGLSFTPPLGRRRSFGWKHAIPAH